MTMTAPDPSPTNPTPDDCVFCEIVQGRAEANIVRSWPHATAFTPVNPVTPGHVLVVPHCHVRDALEDPGITGMVMARAAELATGPCNIITSVGAAATQTVFHLHAHVVPRRPIDGLTLPWTGQRTAPDRPCRPHLASEHGDAGWDLCPACSPDRAPDPPPRAIAARRAATDPT